MEPPTAPSGTTTQVPSAMPSAARGSPVEQVAEAAPAELGSMAQPSDEILHTGSLTVTKPPPLAQLNLSRDEVVNSAAFFFDLVITDIQKQFLAFKPEQAVPNLNAQVQEAFGKACGIEDLPTNIFRVEYQKDRNNLDLMDLGKFMIRIPAALKDGAITIAKEELRFTGDDSGNAYKLEYKDRAKAKFKATQRKKNDNFWFHLLVHKESEIDPMTLFSKVEDHLDKFGITMQTHANSFQLAGLNDMGLPKWHGEYDVDYTRVPLDRYHTYNLEGIGEVLLDEKTGERGRFWFKPECFKEVFNACSICHKNVQACTGHEMKPKSSGKRPMTAAENHAASKQRLKNKAGKSFAFGK